MSQGRKFPVWCAVGRRRASGAILVYLAEKAGRLIPPDSVERLKCLQWPMFQMGGVGPMFGQHNHFAVYAPERIPYAIECYTNGVVRLYRVLDKRLSESDCPAGPDYPIANIAAFPWCATRTGGGSTRRTTPPCGAGTRASRPARRCSAASRSWPSVGGKGR